ncbi:isopeptide-forming domain-containing fimbrial protein [Enterococcus faecalis]|nr:isopeptide-forming domain-containing fimbrial protein [Enterococcus faecalis]
MVNKDESTFRDKKLLASLIAKAVMMLAIVIGAIGLNAINSYAAPVSVKPHSFKDKNELIFKENGSLQGITTSNPDIKVGVVKKGHYADRPYAYWADGKLKATDWIEVYHKNTGTYKGKDVSVRLRLSNFKVGHNKYDNEANTVDGNKNYVIAFGNLINGITFAGYGSQTVEAKFVYTDTGQPVNFEGSTYITFNSLNGKPSMDYLGNNFNEQEFTSYDKMNTLPYYVTTTTGLKEYTNPVTSSGTLIGGIANPATNDKFTDVIGAKDFTNGSVTYTIAGQNPKFVVGTTSNMMWFTLNSSAVFNMNPPAPTKDVKNQSGVNINGQKVQPGQPITYEINQTVNKLNVDILTKYNSFVIGDNLPKEVEYKSARLVDKNNKEVDTKGTYAYDKATHVVKYTASSDFLNKMPMNGETYTLKIDVKVKEDVAANSTIKNKGVVTIDDKPFNTNEVSNITEDPKFPKPDKEDVDTEGKDINGQDVMPGQKIVYRINQKVNVMNKDIYAKYKKFVITDPLPAEVAYESSVVKVNGTVQKDAKAISYDEKSHTATFNADASFLQNMKMNGETITYEITTRVKDDVEPDTIIKNVGNVSINDKPNNTNEVTNKTKDPIIPDPSKEDLDEEGNDINGQQVMAGDTIIYHVNQPVNKLNEDIFLKYKKMILKDPLPSQVAFDSAVVMVDGEVQEGAKEVSYDKDSHTVTFDADENFLKAMKMAGETVTLEIKTHVIDEIEENEQIINKASSFINKEEKETNEVTNSVKVPKGDITINKKTEQRTGIKDSEIQTEKLPQGFVTYKLFAAEDIKFPNGKVIAEKGTEFGEQVTATDGTAKFKDLYEGVYNIVEQKAPVGIQIDPTPIRIELKADKQGEEFIETSGEQEDLRQEVLVKGHKVFEQTDGTFKPSDGATFGLYYADDYMIGEDKILADTLVAEMKTDAEGVFSYKGFLVPNQRYYVKEIDTKNGYLLDNDKRFFVYQPSTNNEIHEIEMFDKGYVADNKFVPYETLNSWDPLKEETSETDTTEASTEDSKKEENSTNQTTNEETSRSEESTTKQSELRKEGSTETSSEDQSSTAETESSEEVIEDGKAELITDNMKEPAEEQKQPIKNILITENSIEKAIKRKDGSLVDHYDILEDKEEITFVGTIYFGNHNPEKATHEISDDLPKGLEYQSMKVLNENNEDVTNKVKVKVNGQKVGFSVDEKYAAELKSTHLTWEITTKYNHSKELEGTKLENTMKFDDLTSNKVTLTPPVVEYESVAPGIFPKTGEEKRRWLTVAGTLLILGAIGFYAYNVYQKKKDE